MEHIVGFTKEESETLECVLSFKVRDYLAEWQVVLFKEETPKYTFEGATYGEYGICFTKVIDGDISDDKYWQFTYGADTLLGTDDMSEKHDRDVGICLHGGGTYEDSINMNADAFHSALDRIERHLQKCTEWQFVADQITKQEQLISNRR